MKKNKKKNKSNEFSFQSKEIKKRKNANDDYKMVIAFIVVLVVIGLFTLVLYLFNGKYVTKDLNQDTSTTEPVYDETKISVADIFKVKKEHYYVLLYKSDDNLSAIYSSISATYSNTDIPLYTVDMSNALNKKYYDESGKENKNPEKYEEVKIARPTLIEIEKGKVISFETNRDNIINTLSK